MTKREQEIMNDYVERNYAEFREEIVRSFPNILLQTGERLRTCNATVFETKNFYYLQSYKTVVAFLRKDSREFFDILRLVYGYTSTSAQHISKFIRDYSGFDDGHTVHIWREIK